jgi:hypothetical protein
MVASDVRCMESVSLPCASRPHIARRRFRARLTVIDVSGGVMADFVKYQLDDGSEVFFESAEGSLVALRGGDADVVAEGKLGDRLSTIADAAEQVSKGLRERLAPEEIELEFGVKVSGEVGWWFFAKASGEAAINVTLTWRKAAEESSGSNGS